MKTHIKVVAILAAITVAAPAVLYVMRSPSRDPLADKLGAYGFYPIVPPSTLVEVGSLYYVSEDGLNYKEVCRVEPTDVAAVVRKSRSVQIEEDLNQTGSFETDIKVKLPELLGGGVTNNYVEKVHFSLTDITLEEIPLENNFQIEAKLMSRTDCNNAVVELLKSDGYVCQGQEILLATAEFKLDRDSRSKVNGSIDLKSDAVKAAVKAAVTTQSDASIVERDGRLYSGSALNYGVEVNPTCLAPPHSRFLRVLPKTRLDRLVNYVRYRIIEPWLPPTPDPPQAVAQAADSK